MRQRAFATLAKTSSFAAHSEQIAAMPSAVEKLASAATSRGISDVALHDVLVVVKNCAEHAAGTRARFATDEMLGALCVVQTL